MATTAQIITNRKPLRGVNYETTNYFMQNKPNFRKAKMKLNFYSAKDYENETAFSLRENKPNQTQFQPKNEANKPNRTQFQPKNEANKPNQTQFLYHWFCLLFIIAPKYREFDRELCI